MFVTINVTSIGNLIGIASKYFALGFPFLLDDPKAFKVFPCPHEWAWTLGLTGTLPS